MPKQINLLNIKKMKSSVSKAKLAKKPIISSTPLKVEQKVFAPSKYPGKIEITQGFGVLASISFQLGEKLKERPVEVRAKDIYADAGSLDALRVGEQYRHKGYATQLMTELINYAKKQNLGNIYLRVNKHNLGAIGLYNKMGFKVVRDIGSSEQLMAFYRV